MQTLNVGAMVIKMYDSIEDLPILRYHKFNKCLLVDAGIGADIGSVDRHLLKARTYIRRLAIRRTERELGPSSPPTEGWRDSDGVGVIKKE